MNNKPKSALLYLVLIVLFSTVLSESIGMLILHHTKTDHSDLVLLDSLLLVILLIPVLYLFGYMPLDAYIKKTEKLNAEKDETIRELNAAIGEIKTLQGILPICASCKQIRDDKGYWNQIESYIKNHSDADFSHGICPDCATKLYPELFDENGVLKSDN